MRIAILVTRWNELVTRALLQGAVETLRLRDEVRYEVIEVPGAWEIPLFCSMLIREHRVDGIVALGCILQGETMHADLLASDVSSTLMRLQTDHLVPIGWGVLTPQNAEQAMDRAGMKHGNKGREAAEAVLSVLDMRERLGSGEFDFINDDEDDDFVSLKSVKELLEDEDL